MKTTSAEITYSCITPGKEEYFKLFESTGWNEEYRLNSEQLYKSMLNSYFMVSAFDNDLLVGFARVISDGILHALIADMIVLPEYQGMGIGRSILKKVCDKCQADGIKDIQLFAARGKAGFYENCGFSQRPGDAPGMELKKSSSADAAAV